MTPPRKSLVLVALLSACATPEPSGPAEMTLQPTCRGDSLLHLLVEVDAAGKFMIPVEQLRQLACKGA
jgi:hypothetical protein